MLLPVPGLSKVGVESAPPACEFAAAATDPSVLSPLWLSVEVPGSPCMACLPWLRSTPKNNPPVQCGGPPPAACARTDTDSICRPRNHLPEPDLPLIRNESRQANAVGSRLARRLGFSCPLRHGTNSCAASASFDRRTRHRARAARWRLCAHRLARSPILPPLHLASGKIDRSSASVPVTNGVAALVPPPVSDCPLLPRLVMASPGAIRPRRAIEAPRLDTASGLPAQSQATTGMTHGWRVIAEPPTVP